MTGPYSKRAQELAYELSVKASRNLVERHGYTVWCDVETHRHHWERPATPPSPPPPKPGAWQRLRGVLRSKP